MVGQSSRGRDSSEDELLREVVVRQQVRGQHEGFIEVVPAGNLPWNDGQ